MNINAHTLSASCAWFTVLCFASTVAADGNADMRERYDGEKVVRVKVRNPMDVAFIEQMGGDIWSHQPFGDEIDVRVSSSQLTDLNRSGLAHQVWIDNVQALVEAERATERGGNFLENYHSYDEIIAFLEQLVTNHPTLATMFHVGFTIEGREIQGIRIASPSLPDTSPGVIYFSTVHAREWVTTTVTPYLADHLLNNYGTDPEVTNLVDNVEWMLIPVGNPDGYEYSRNVSRFWRKNRRNNGDSSFGVDINRNWGWGWGGVGSSDMTNSQIYRGTGPFSEPETTALRDLFLSNPNVRAQLDIHSYSQLILWPWGNVPTLPSDQASYQAIGTQMQQSIFNVYGRFYNKGPVYSAIYPVSGGSLDWTYGERGGVMSFSFEMRDTGAFGFALPASQILPNNEELLPAILDLTGSDAVMATQIHVHGEVVDRLTSGEPTNIAVVITSGVESLNVASAQCHYRYDASGPFKVTAMQQVAGVDFMAVLPATNCTSTPEFYFSIDSASGLVTEPSDAPATVYSATMLPQSPWGCLAAYGDYNGDLVIDLLDHAEFVPCMQGPLGGLLPECGIFDFDQSNDIDLVDMQQMQLAIGQP